LSTYEEAGVSIDAGDEFVRRIRANVRSTFSPEVLTDIGSFGAFYDAGFKGMKSPVLVSSTDGVGTKLRLAFLMNQHDTIGQDLVNHCVNDVAVCGARPLFFLDYLAVGKLQLDIAESVISGMVKACYENGCSLIGGETAEMPGFYREKEYDLAGTIVGVVDREAILDGKKMRAGDVVIGLPSTGLHTNGYSLARSVLFERHEYDDFIEPLGMTLGESLLKIHRSYLRPIEAISGLSALHGLAHITGGGIEGNTRRIVPPTLELQLDWQSWQRPPIFELIQKLGNVPEEDMRRAFNLGIGLVIVAGKRGASGLMETLRSAGEQPMVIGEIRKH
jgi:phosphoribosylformylglycinamidine cyclo-ligase